MTAAHALAMLASLGFGIALITSRVGLRHLDARSGAAVSIPSATLLFVLAAPFAFGGGGWSLPALLLFAAVGLVFPVAVTLLTFRANRELGPTITGAVSGTAPLFAIGAGALLLAEAVPARAWGSCAAIVVGVALLSWKQGAVRPGFSAHALAWPIAGALLRGLAQVAAKAGLALWPSPFAAALIGYLVSSATIIGVQHLPGAPAAKLSGRGAGWFVATGLLNGGAVLLMYAALGRAPVSVVAPVVATYPLVTALLSAAVLRDEPLTARMVLGAVIVATAVAYLVSPGL